ncbi:MAG: M20/M25/M40 family metallo-hydrolase [Chloroflexi bacterium]|nr:M20/M25/M40 family metallo-hydrolase [Chloroflexota bacterium]
MIDEERLKRYFLDLVQIDSVSRAERAIAQRLARDLEALGIPVVMDDAGSATGADAGNLIARIDGNVPGARPLFLSAHMDTVAPGNGVRPVVEGDIVRTDGTTVLGADDKSGVAIIMEVLRTLKAHELPHGPLDIVFSICEERGLLGAKALDVSRLRARDGLVLDCDDPHVLFTQGPAANHMRWRIIGVEAHAGVAPERGISALQVAAEAIAQMKLGRIDTETTANLGTIQGGTATNIIPNLVEVHGEARSRSVEKLEAQTAHMTACFEEAAARHRLTVDGQTLQARVETSVERAYDLLNVPDDAPIVRLVLQAAATPGTTIETRATGGGCDANVYNGKGLRIANLGTGMRDIHTVKEAIDLQDMSRCARVVLELVQINAQDQE